MGGTLAAVWAGSKTIFGPIFLLVAVLIAARAVAWFVRAKRGY
jgi:hypothetical protein